MSGFASRHGAGEFDVSLRMTNYTKEPPPFNLTVRKGSKTVALSRNFVLFALSSPVALDLYNWLQDSSVPDEHFYSTLATIPQAETNDQTIPNNGKGQIVNAFRMHFR
jgi:hypothetical protein